MLKHGARRRQLLGAQQAPALVLGQLVVAVLGLGGRVAGSLERVINVAARLVVALLVIMLSAGRANLIGNVQQFGQIGHV